MLSFFLQKKDIRKYSDFERKMKNYTGRKHKIRSLESFGLTHTEKPVAPVSQESTGFP